MEFSIDPMPHSPQNENSVLGKIVAAFRSTPAFVSPRCLSLGIGDDAALFRPTRGYETILTCDWFLEGTHFLRAKHPPDAVGWKCLARAVSDVAAMGGTPRSFLLSLALPPSHTGRWLDRFLNGLRRASRKTGCLLAGGDTTRRGSILIQVTAIGEVRVGFSVLRSGAHPGDILYVSGRLGEAELGLQLLRRGSGFAAGDNPATKKHLYPIPRLALGQYLASKKLVTAMMDLSDGLSSDLRRLCEASRVGAKVELARIPLVQNRDLARKHRHDPLQLALHGGDDYELLFTVPSRKAKWLPKTFEGVPLTPIGAITAKRNELILNDHGHIRKLLPGGWDPFRKKL